ATNNRRASYGELCTEAAQLAIPEKVARKPAAQRTLIGKPVAQIGLAEKVTGKAKYGIDVDLPNVLVGTIAQCPYFGGRLKQVDEKPALVMPGVRRVVKLENAVAVVADHFWAAKQGLAALSPQWTKPAEPLASDDAMFVKLRSEIGAADSV